MVFWLLPVPFGQIRDGSVPAIVLVNIIGPFRFQAKYISDIIVFSNSFLLCLFEKLEPALPDKNCEGTKENIGHRALKWIRTIFYFEPFLVNFKLYLMQQSIAGEICVGSNRQSGRLSTFPQDHLGKIIFRQGEGGPLSGNNVWEKIRKIRITTNTSGQAKVPPTLWILTRS